MHLMNALVSSLNADISLPGEPPPPTPSPACFRLQQRLLEGRETVLPSSVPEPVLFPFTYLSLLFSLPPSLLLYASLNPLATL